MTAFAANSLLNRMAVEGGWIDPMSFALIRVAAGAAMLVLLVRLQGKRPELISRRRVMGALSLATYMIGFSLAYRVLDAGLGALILFGVVQVSMFCAAALQGAGGRPRQIAGATIAFAGLAWVLWPGPQGLAAPAGALAMAAAGLGWAVYSLIGRSEPDALAGTAGNFCLCLPVVGVAYLGLGQPAVVAPAGVLLAVLSGAVTSGLGYALWYRVLPQIAATTAATVQLSVPVIAILGGAALLGEPLSGALLLAALIVLGGIALSIPRSIPRSSSGSSPGAGR